MTEGVVERLYVEFRQLAETLDKNSEASLRITADDCFRKALLLSAASYFENALTSEVIKFFEMNSRSARSIEFVRRKAIQRQYHTLFDWESSNANRFFSLFGDECRTSVEKKCKADANFEKAVVAFIELGRERNRLVHQNFGAFSLEKTADEIYQLYEQGLTFVRAIRGILDAPDVPQAGG